MNLTSELPIGRRVINRSGVFPDQATLCFVQLTTDTAPAKQTVKDFKNEQTENVLKEVSPVIQFGLNGRFRGIRSQFTQSFLECTGEFLHIHFRKISHDRDAKDFSLKRMLT